MNIVEIPNELKLLLGVFVTMLVTQALKWLSEKLKYDLSGYAAQVTASLVGAVLVAINAAASNVPAEFVPVANQVLVLAVVVLGSFGAYKVFVKGNW